MKSLTPKEIVAALDRHIVGQNAAKKAVAIALRNRWRRQQLPEELQTDITPKNILMIGPTGVGKTEIARRLAQLISAPFVKVEATKYTEVGYHGRDVDSMVRDLTEVAIGMIRGEQRKVVETQAVEKVNEKLVDLLVPSSGWDTEQSEEQAERNTRTREKMKAKLLAGELEEKEVEIQVEQKQPQVTMLGLGQMESDLQTVLEKMMPKQTANRKVPIKEARKILTDQEAESLIDKQVVIEKAIKLVENQGILFLDELDKVCGPQSSHGPDVSRQGVQRDLLPIVEGTTVSTRYGPVSTDHILFIAAGAFHTSKPSDLMPELQGRFPIRVELEDLGKADFLRILSEPQHALTKQYTELMATEGVNLTFTRDALEEMAELAYEANRATQNIGARRLHTIIERLVEEISYAGPDWKPKDFTIDRAYVRSQIAHLFKKEDLSKFIL
jgi:ATP-dependent HslUV protease ATP-binding subunit HslU